ncbi:MAG: adenylate/guanylate cyclase domain-containing protein [Marivibrio sp.]|uniref:adenylate/guanylate cyclase domain-containing protein n=1 Tax=Marivibrio sp. TaxID=2039719 RepID=UPI0032EC9CBA
MMSEAGRLALLAGAGVDPTAYEAGEFEGAVAALIADGQYFVAHDLARTGLERFAHDPALRRLAAEAALRAGALGEARRLAEPLEGALVRRNPKVRAAYDRLADVLRAAEPSAAPSDEALDAVAGLAGAFAELGRGRTGAAEGETFLLLGRLHLALWRRDGGAENLAAAADVLADGVRLTRRADLAAEAAVAAYLAGERARAAEFAAQAVADPSATDEARLEALLIAGEVGRAEAALAAHPPERGAAAALRARLEQLADAGLSVPAALLAAVKPPVIALFTGHMIDAPDRASPRFPAPLEAAAKAAIAAELEAIDCRIGYSAAASGGDILFLEALAERGAEVNIVLPFAKPDFVAASVAAAGERWVARFENLLKIADTVSYATTEKHLGDDVLFRYGAQVMEGMAELRAELLGAQPYLVALWDGTPTRIVGGTADMAALWAPTGRLRMVNLTALRAPGGDAPDDEALIARLMEAPPPSEDDTHTGRRRIQAMLFADVVGFSKIDEEHVPDFVRFLTHVADAMTGAPTPVFLNTWGDAIFAVTDTAEEMARYALALQAAILEARAKLTGPAAALDLRIALHAGPAYRETDPLTGRPNFYGGHVNRAARIEPVTVPGQVYCSEQFTALLAAEAVQQGETAGGAGRPWRVEYVGDMALAKKFGKQKVYSLRGR